MSYLLWIRNIKGWTQGGAIEQISVSSHCCLPLNKEERDFSRRRQWQPTPVLLPGKSHGQRSLVGCSPWGREESDTTERLHFHALEKEMATYSSVLAWIIPGKEEPDGLPSVGSHRVGHDFSDLAAAAEMLVGSRSQLARSRTRT